ncbi:MAG: AAA domain-containing protein [Hymenobacter sp.]
MLEQVQVITCTLVGASNRNIRHLTYETVFIDEAAQALEPGCWIPISQGPAAWCWPATTSSCRPP